MIEHHIQKEILDRLSQASELRFSELKPKELESNAFLYHVNLLIKQEYIEKSDTKYRLSPKGLTYVDGLSLKNSNPRKQPKILCVLVLRNKNGDYLLARRKYQPFIGTLLFPGGKQHYGESPEAHVSRELKEQFGLAGEPVRRGVVDQRTYLTGRLITHVLALVYCLDFDGSAPADTKKFHYQWVNLKDATELYPGTVELYQQLQQHSDSFFLSLDVNAD